MITSPTDIRAASTPEPVRVVMEDTNHLLEYIEIERGEDGAGVDIWRHASEEGQRPMCSLLALCDGQASEMARAVLGIAEPGAVVLSASQAARLAQLAALLDLTTPCRAFYENDEIVRDLRGIAGELRRMSGRARLAFTTAAE